MINGGDVAQTVAGVVDDFNTLTDSDASLGSRVLAGVSLASEVISPVSIGDAKDAVKGVKAIAGKLGDSSTRTVSKIEDVTKPGSVPNIKTDVSKAEFEGNLVDNGFEMSTSKDGKVNIFEKGDQKFTTRDSSKSTGGPTAEAFKGGEKTSKIRLEDQ